MEISYKRHSSSVGCMRGKLKSTAYLYSYNADNCKIFNPLRLDVYKTNGYLHFELHTFGAYFMGDMEICPTIHHKRTANKNSTDALNAVYDCLRLSGFDNLPKLNTISDLFEYIGLYYFGNGTYIETIY